MDVFEELRRRGNNAVAYALNGARTEFHKGRLDDYEAGYALGQILVASCDLRAEKHIVEGARNEIHFLARTAKRGGAR